jgi:hypothetical protein
MSKVLRGFLISALAAGGLAGCQTPRQSAANAAITCEAAGLRPGTRRFERCEGLNYAQNRAQASQAEAAVATAAAAGVIGGALVGAAASRPYYYGPAYPAYYPVYRPYWW